MPKRPDIPLESLGALFKKLHQRCECEKGNPRKECKEAPLDRWWVTYLLEGQKK